MAAEARVGSEEAVERFGAGMALLPWTRHMLLVLWDQLRLLVQIIYYTFISVFQMFRFEVHVRITDDPSVTPDPSDPFLFSSLFSEDAAADHTGALLSTLRGEDLCCDADGGIYIGHKHPSSSSSWSVGDWNIFVSSSEARCSDEERSGASCWSSEEEHSLEFDCDESKALWESLSRSNDPYDPFCFSACISTRSKALWETQSCAAAFERLQNRTSRSRKDAPEEQATPSVNQQQAHKHLQSEEQSKGSWETESKCSHVCSPGLDREDLLENQSEEKRVSSDVCASCDEQTESRAFWETESGSFDSCSPEIQSDVLDLNERIIENESEESWETESDSTKIQTSEEDEGKASWERSRVPPVGRFWESSSSEDSDAEDSPATKSLVSRSDSDSSWSSENSEDGSETSQQREENQLLWDLFTNNSDPFNPMCFSATNRSREEEHDAEDELWSGLSKEQDPYHPLNFCVLKKNQRNQQEQQRNQQEQQRNQQEQQRNQQEQQRAEGADSDTFRRSFRRRRGVKPELTQRNLQKHSHPQMFLRPWTRASSAQTRAAEASSAPGPEPRQKKVRFSDEVRVHVMRSWLFAREASRRGPWEESARDRERFRRRIQEAERSVGACLRPEHRERVRTGTRTRTRPGLDQDQNQAQTGSGPGRVVDLFSGGK